LKKRQNDTTLVVSSKTEVFKDPGPRKGMERTKDLLRRTQGGSEDRTLRKQIRNWKEKKTPMAHMV